MKSALVPDRGDGRLALFHKRETEKRAALHRVLEGFSLVGSLDNFLKFADSFLEQTHFAESDAEVVVRFEIFVFAAHFAEFGAEFIEDFL